MGKASLSVAAILALTFFLSFWAASGAIYNVPESAIKAAAETEIKPRAEPIEVFVVPHSHDDVGWIVTMEEYFTSEVQYIYDTVLQCLLHDSRRRFIIVEVGYLKRWWEQASNQSQSDMLHLYKNGQIEFIIGGIVMSDEAAASYVARVNQLQEGHKFLTEHFGAIPRIGWQIDPFGASVGTPVLQAWDCFDALVIARIPYWQKTNRENNKTMEFIWHGTTNLGQETDMFTHVMDDYGYCTPNGFAFGDSWNIYEPPNPNPPVEKYNIALRAAELVKNIQSRAAWFQTNNLLFAFGCDFNYQNAWTMYKNMDKLIDYINERQDKFGVHLKYSLLSDYFDAIHQTQTSWPEYTGDFFPYNDNNVSYWTGYYTSRNKLKGMTREADNTQRVADIAVSLVKGLGALVDQSGVYDLLRLLRFQNAVAQHHDGVSGTARPQVVDDYELRIKEGTIANNIVIEEYVAQDLSKNGVHPLLTLNEDYMHLDLKSGKTVATVVQNTLAWNRTDFVQLHIPSGVVVNVTDSNGKPVPSQIDAGKAGENKDSLWFQASIPALGISTYFLTPVKTGMPTTSVRSRVIHDYVVDFRKEGQSAVLHPRSKLNVMANPIQISNGQLTVGFNNATGLVNTVYSKSLNKTITVTQDYLEYNSSADPVQSSGAYIFRNNGTAVSLSKYTDTFNIHVVSGPLVQTVHQTWEMTVNISSFTPKYQTNVTQTIRLLTSSDPFVNNRIDIRHGVGPLDGNKEFITRWVTPIASNLYFYQDDSGFLTMQRRYNSSQSLPIPGNYYPMVSTSYIQDSTQRLTVISAQSHGCASLANGELEVMLHRRTLQDDGRGVGAPLNDTNRLEMPHFVLYDSPTASEQARHRLRLMLDFPLTVLYGTLSSSNISTWTSKYATSLSPLANPLPPNLHMLNLQIFDGSSDTIVLRLQHLFQAGSDPTYAVPVTINLSSLFNSNYVITNVVPLTLSANQNLSTCQSKRWTWNSLSSIGREPQVPVSPLADDRVTVTIQPSQILTFSIHLSPNV